MNPDQLPMLLSVFLSLFTLLLQLFPLQPSLPIVLPAFLFCNRILYNGIFIVFTFTFSTITSLLQTLLSLLVGLGCRFVSSLRKLIVRGGFKDLELCNSRRWIFSSIFLSLIQNCLRILLNQVIIDVYSFMTFI